MTRCRTVPESIYQVRIQGDKSAPEMTVLVSLSPAEESELRRFNKNESLCSDIDLQSPYLPVVKTLFSDLKIIGIISAEAEKFSGRMLSDLIAHVARTKVVFAEL